MQQLQGRITWGPIFQLLHSCTFAKMVEYSAVRKKRIKNYQKIVVAVQGGRCWGSAGAALHDRSGSSTTGRTPNIRYFVAKLGIVAIYALFERLS